MFYSQYLDSSQLHDGSDAGGYLVDVLSGRRHKG